MYAMRTLTSLILATLAAFAPLARAETCGTSAKGFNGFVAEMKQQAKAAGVSASSIAVLDTVEYDAGIIRRDRAQNVFADSFLAFQARMISAGRITRGKAMLQKHAALFKRVESEFGVPGPVIAAFWALETDFGAVMGNENTIQALVTLGWDCRRPEKFRPQIIAALQLLDRGDLPLSSFKGAWAGEIGQTQFMAYDYNESAIDYDGDGRRDLRQSVPDVIASTANLLRKHGWQAGEPWLQEVKITADLPWAEADIAVAHPRSQWAQWGIVGITGKAIKADGREAALLLPMGRKGPAFLAYRNFTTAYLKWNESLVYSTTAAYLATRLAGAAPVQKGNGAVEHPSFAQIQALQERLSALGYDIGKVDGKIGKGTRAAVKDQQVKLGLPPDSYPAADIIDQLGTGKAARKATKPATKASAKPAAKPAKKPKADAAIEGNSLY